MATNIDGDLHKPRRRNIMRAFKISEISAVDRPAQEGAKAAIIKRAENVIGAALYKRWIDPADGAMSFDAVLQNNMDSKLYCDMMEAYSPTISALDTSLRSIVGDTNLDPLTKQSMMRDAVEGFMAQARQSFPAIVPAVSKALNLDEGAFKMTEKELQKQVADLTAELAKLKAAGEETAKKADELSKANAELTAKAAAATEEAEALKAKSKLTPQQQAFIDQQENEAQGEDKKKSTRKSLMAMSSDALDRLIVEKRANDEVITIDGEEVRKSVIGASQFNILKKQSERVAALEKSSKEAVEKAETAELAKRADEEFSHLPGTTDEKVGVLRAIGKADKPVQEAFAKMMKAGEKAVVSAFEKLGHRGGSAEVDKGAFEKRVAEIRKRDDCSRQAAMETARKEYPQEFAAYQGQN